MRGERRLPRALDDASRWQRVAVTLGALGPTPLRARGAEARLDTLWIRVSAAGQAEAFRRTMVTAQLEGWVEAVPARENQQVSRGSLMAVIDSTEYALGVEQARADLLTAEADFRQMVLFEDEIEDTGVREERRRVARARSGLDQREVELRRAELELARTRVTAPFEGRVANIRVVQGQYVTPGRGTSYKPRQLVAGPRLVRDDAPSA